MADTSRLPEDLTRPEGALGRVLNAFGLQWTNVAVLSGVLFSTFGLEKYMNSGVWALTAVASFCAAYFFRRQVTGSLPKVTAGCVTAAALLIGSPVAISAGRGSDVGALLAGHRNFGTAYLASSVVVPLAVTIIAYRRQEENLGGFLPPAIEQAVTNAVVRAPFYREDQRYVVTLVSVTEEKVVLRTELTYAVRNRRAEAQQWQGSFVSPSLHTRYLRVAIDERELDVTDPDYLSRRGLQVTRILSPHGEIRVEFDAEEEFRARDSELYTAYAPTDSLRLTVVNPSQDRIRFHIETLYPIKAEPETNGDSLICSIDTGLLPYQGFRLHWSPLASVGGGE